MPPPRIFGLRPAEQIDLDDVMSSSRAEYTEHPVYIEKELYELLTSINGDGLAADLEAYLRDVFLNCGSSARWVESDALEDGEVLRYFMDDNEDENGQSYYMILRSWDCD